MARARTPARRGESEEIEVAGRMITVTNPGKLLWPEAGFTKLDVVRYLVDIAPVLLPHLRERPLTLKRYPNGVDADFFYEKQCPKHRPDWVRTVTVWSSSSRRDISFCVVDDAATLAWLGNLADLELHASLAMQAELTRPTVLAFDLDPGSPATIVECCRVGLLVRDMFAQFGMESFAKSSGSKGMQVYVPLNVDDVSFDDTKAFAKGVAQLLEAEHPELVVSKMLKRLRGGKVLVDWSQNDEHKTTVCPYSLRAKATPTVSTPVTWAEVEAALEAADPDLLSFESQEVLRRVAAHGDLFAPVLELEQPLPALDL